MFHFSYGRWAGSISDPVLMPLVFIPTDFKKEGIVGTNDYDNSYLIVTGPDPKTRLYVIYSLDKPILQNSKDINLDARNLWSNNKELFIMQRFLTLAYNMYMRGENILAFLEHVFEERDNSKK